LSSDTPISVPDQRLRGSQFDADAVWGREKHSDARVDVREI